MAVIVAALAVCTVPSGSGAPGSEAYIQGVQHGTSAIDLRGVKHDGAKYGRKVPPWMAERLRAVAPKYPVEDRRLRNEGRGVYELDLDPQTGRVTRVVVAKSTGFRSLDQAAVAALRKWQWKPGRWKQIVMPVTFTMRTAHDSPAVGSIPIPHW